MATLIIRSATRPERSSRDEPLIWDVIDIPASEEGFGSDLEVTCPVDGDPIVPGDLLTQAEVDSLIQAGHTIDWTS